MIKNEILAYLIFVGTNTINIKYKLEPKVHLGI